MSLNGGHLVRQCSIKDRTTSLAGKNSMLMSIANEFFEEKVAMLPAEKKSFRVNISLPEIMRGKIQWSRSWKYRPIWWEFLRLTSNE